MSDPPEKLRPVRAVGPAADLESMQRAYLDLLKLSLCDLAGVQTHAVHWSDTGEAFSRELGEQELKYRAIGLDWPLHGLTMIGLKRLDDLQACVESIVGDRVEGDLVEAGVWRGGASILMRATLDTFGAGDRLVWLADSFSGFPKPDLETFPDDADLDLSKGSFQPAPIDEVRASFERLGSEDGVRFVQGFFRDTLPGLRGGQWSLVRLDGDSYESTWVGLENLYPGLSTGGYLVIDDYGCLEECRKAVGDYRSEHGIGDPIEMIDWTGARWRKTGPRSTDATPLDRDLKPDPTSDPAAAPVRPHIPSLGEQELRAEIEQLRNRLRVLGEDA